MLNVNLIADTVKDLSTLKFEKQDGCGSILLNRARKLSSENYNDITMILGMCVNKELGEWLRLARIQYFSEFIKELDRIPGMIVERYSDLNKSLVNGLRADENHAPFLGYLNNLTAALVSGIRVEQIPSLEYFTHEMSLINYRRKQVYQQMLLFLPKPDKVSNTPLSNFTSRHRIELPVMYVVAWDLIRYCAYLNKRDYESNQNINKSILPSEEDQLFSHLKAYIPLLSSETKKILFGDPSALGKESLSSVEDSLNVSLDLRNIFNRQEKDIIKKFEESSIRCSSQSQMEYNTYFDRTSGKLCVSVKRVLPLRLQALLPVIEFNVHKNRSLGFCDGLEHERQHIKEEILSTIPFVPLTVEKSTLSGNSLFSVTADLFQEVVDREQEKGDMIGIYAHNWRHISYPTIVKDVADALLAKGGDSEFVTLANKLRRAYNSELNLRRGIELLQHLTSSDEQAVRKQFRNGIIISGVEKSQTITGIQELFNNSLDMVVLRLVMDDVDQSDKMINRRSKIPNLESLREDYVDRFLGKTPQGFEDISLLEWIKPRLLDLSVKLSEEWEAVRVNSDSFAAAQITSIFVELLTNIVLHGTDRATLDFRTSSKTLDIYAENTCSSEAALSTTGDGISMLRKVVGKINYSRGISDAVTHTLSSGTYLVCIKLDKKLLYKPDL